MGHHTTPPPTVKHEMKEASYIKSDIKWPPLPSHHITNPGGQQEGEHGVVHNVQGEHYQRNVVRVQSP